MNFYTTYVTRAIPIGGVVPIPIEQQGVDIDSMFLECNGSSILQDYYPGLFNIIGTEYGGDATHFNLPDFRGMFLRHVFDSHVVGEYEADCIINHTHLIKEDKNDASHATNNGVSALQTKNYTDYTYSSSLSTWVGGNETRPMNVYARYCVRYR